MILILLLILNNSSVGHTRAELKSKPTAIPCQNHAILSVDYKLSIILGRRRPEQWRGWDGKVFTNKARWKYAYCIEGRQVEYKCGLLSQYLSMNFATWWCSTTLYNVLNDAFQALIAFIVPISFKYIWSNSRFTANNGLQELDRVTLLYNSKVDLLVSGTIFVVLLFVSVVFVLFPVCTTQYKACLMLFIYFHFVLLFRCPLYRMYDLAGKQQMLIGTLAFYVR